MHLTIIKCKEKQGHLRLQKGATKLTDQTDSSNKTDSYLTKIIFNKLWILTLNIRKNGFLWSWGAGNFTGIVPLFSRSFQERLIVESNLSNATCDRVGYSESMQAMEASFMLEWDEGITIPSNATWHYLPIITCFFVMWLRQAVLQMLYQNREWIGLFLGRDPLCDGL